MSAAAFVAPPEVPSGTFRFSCKSVHLTYKTHIDPKTLLLWFKTKHDLDMYSIVNENGHGDREEPTEGDEAIDYPHTHALLIFPTRFQTRNQRFWDYEGIHPHINPLTTKTHIVNTWKYHTKEPVHLLQSDKAPYAVPGSLAAAIGASSLLEACTMFNIQPKTVNDMQTLRCCKDIAQVIPPLVNPKAWTREFCTQPVVFLTGPSGTGKTRWALAHFETPLLVRHMDDLKKLASTHDGVVFDDMALSGYTTSIGIHLTDFEMPSTINVKHGAVTLPAGLRRIFTSNAPFDDYFPPDPHGAIKRRVYCLQIYGSLFAAPVGLSRTMTTGASLLLDGSLPPESWIDQLLR